MSCLSVVTAKHKHGGYPGVICITGVSFHGLLSVGC